MSTPRHVLIFRFSSLGDVAMTVPVILLLLKQYPTLRVTVVSTAFVQPLFEGIDRLYFEGVDLKGRHKGVAGMKRLGDELKKKYQFDAVADLHNVLRTKLLRYVFGFSRYPIAAINKGRKEKKQATRRHHKILRPLKSTFQRYADVFAALGLPVHLEKEGGIKRIAPAGDFKYLKTHGDYLIGIAPFARYEEKMYPAEKMKEVIRLLGQHKNISILLFGGAADAPLLEQWAEEFDGAESLAGKMSFRRELEAISQVQLMVSMDSANMHFASLFGVPVISIWGGTHPWLGFYGWGQDPGNAIQVDLDCRPSSVFGNKPCYRGDLACLQRISPLMVYEAIMNELKKQSS